MGKKRGRPVINDPEKSREYYELRVKFNKQEKEILDLACKITGYSRSKTIREALLYACALGGLN